MVVPGLECQPGQRTFGVSVRPELFDAGWEIEALRRVQVLAHDGLPENRAMATRMLPWIPMSRPDWFFRASTEPATGGVTRVLFAHS